MKINKTIKLTLLFVIFFQTGLISQTTDINHIVIAFKNGDAKKIYESCEDIVSLQIPDVKGKFSKTQTRQILEVFFKNHPPVIVKTLKTESNSTINQYSIIEYRSQNKNYNVFIQLKKDQNAFLIQTIQIQETKLLNEY